MASPVFVPLPEEIVADLQVKIGGQVPSLEQDAEAGFDPDSSVPPKDQKKMDRFILLAMAAADEAIRQAGWTADTEDKQERTATVIASGIGGFPAIAHAAAYHRQPGCQTPFAITIPSFLVNLAAGHVSIKHQFKGPIGAPLPLVQQASRLLVTRYA
jgi:3-oxoacyl-[acyl-carrier-protein] synthase II